VDTHFVQLPQLLRQAVLESPTGADLEAIYGGLCQRLRWELEEMFVGIRERRAGWEAESPGPLRVDDLFLDGPVSRARSWSLGGTRYTSVVVSLAGLASAADAMVVIAEAASGAGRLTLSDLQRAIAIDFDGDERLRQLCVNATRFGQDEATADDHAVRLLDLALDEIDAASGPGGTDEVLTFRCLETDMRHLPFGAQTGATAEGRRAGEPISENTSPTPGAARLGFTAMLRSLAKLPFHRVHSGALNLRLQPEIFAGDQGLSRLADLLRTYFDLGGLQVQLSVVDVAELRDAQVHAERHRDLMVRITGYSAAFVDMTRSAQDEIIRREELGN
jgi:formate C-acetyltransferase